MEGFSFAFHSCCNLLSRSSPRASPDSVCFQFSCHFPCAYILDDNSSATIATLSPFTGSSLDSLLISLPSADAPATTATNSLVTEPLFRRLKKHCREGRQALIYMFCIMACRVSFADFQLDSVNPLAFLYFCIGIHIIRTVTTDKL